MTPICYLEAHLPQACGCVGEGVQSAVAGDIHRLEMTNA